jgi:hypothetical protein
MEERCANAECSERFDYRWGRLCCCRIQIETDGPATSRHYWLCGFCAEKFTFRRRAGLGLTLIPRPDVAPDGPASKKAAAARAA